MQQMQKQQYEMHKCSIWNEETVLSYKFIRGRLPYIYYCSAIIKSIHTLCMHDFFPHIFMQIYTRRTLGQETSKRSLYPYMMPYWRNVERNISFCAPVRSHPTISIFTSSCASYRRSPSNSSKRLIKECTTTSFVVRNAISKQKSTIHKRLSLENTLWKSFLEKIYQRTKI